MAIVCEFQNISYYIIVVSHIDQDLYSLHFVWFTEVYSEYKKKVINPKNLLFLPIDDLFFWVIQFLAFICISMRLLLIVLGFILLTANHQGNDDNYQG